MDNTYRIIEVEDGEKKCTYTKEILENLPEWFGNKQALNDYVEKVKDLPYWGTFDENDSCVGFFAVKTHYDYTGEILVCGILPEYQHIGIGKALYSVVEKYFIQSGCKFVIVKTLSEIVDYEPYARTRNFYKSVGFKPLITLTEMWDEENPCLIMLKALV